MASRSSFHLAAVVACAVLSLPPRESGAQTVSPSTTIDVTIPPGENYDLAEFRLWIPRDLDRARATLVLVPGSNGDGRSMVEDSLWQALAKAHGLALVGCRFTDRSHDMQFIEEYVEVSRGSGQALLDALAGLAESSAHPELEHAPLLLWGMSAGGQFNYEFVGWRPDRVVAFVVNKGGIYYSALLSRQARAVPGLLFTGERDSVVRTDVVKGLFALNRRGGGLWALVNEPGTGHAVGRSAELGAVFFEEVLPLRLPEAGRPGYGASLRELRAADGFVGEVASGSYGPAGEARPTDAPSAWLPTERMARAWRAVVTGVPFER